MTELPRSPVWRYGVALLAFALPLVLSSLLRRWHLNFDSTWLLIIALIAVSWYAGRGPGLLFALLFALTLSYYSPPAYKLKFNLASFNRLILFTALAVMTSSRRRAEAALKSRLRQQAAIVQFGQLALADNVYSALPVLINEAASLAARHLGVEYAGVWELLPDGQTMQLQAGVGWEEKAVIRGLLGDSSAAQSDQLVPAHEPLVITDLTQETRFPIPPELRDRQIKSGISLLIVGTNQSFGVLSAHTTKRREFAADELNFLRALANILAEAIERRQRERVVHESREWLRVTLASIGDGVIATDIQGYVTFMNIVASRLTGWTAEEAVGKPLYEVFQIINEETRQTVESPVNKVIWDGEVVGLANHTVLIAKDGTERAIDDSGAPIRDAVGNLIGVILVFHDVTERRRNERERAELLELERQARAEAESLSLVRDEFLLTVSHELRAPLNSILGWAHLLSQSSLDPNTAERALASILDGARLQTRLIDDLLEASRIVAGKLHLNLDSIELGAIVESAIKTIRPAAEAKNIQLWVKLTSEPITVRGDADRLLQVVWNLLSNAVKFTPAGGSVEVSLERQPDQVEIVVHDTGQGIDPEFLPYVFERFSQADSTSTRRYGGLGIGLALVRYLAELHGGAVKAESLGLGQGATFTITLPTERKTASVVQGTTALPRLQQTTAALPTNALAGLQVLVVDDERDTLDLLTAILSQQGAEVTTADSASAALHLLEQRRPDVLVSDIGMPVQNGYDLIGKLRARAPQEGGDIPAIALTAYARAEDQELALAAGFQMHVSKPVEPDVLVKSIAALTKQSLNRREDNSV
jgi:PAS domain S-box-containing protein